MLTTLQRGGGGGKQEAVRLVKQGQDTRKGAHKQTTYTPLLHSTMAVMMGMVYTVVLPGPPYVMRLYSRVGLRGTRVTTATEGCVGGWACGCGIYTGRPLGGLPSLPLPLPHSRKGRHARMHVPCDIEA